ncbi:hypothetical protein [Cohnella luojiensis]|uniref:Phage tail assembly protein n=1 Tax=Cohnella luojiensis TaxID=652876 RepID=A0A4Y8M587_9BACL|nr:hypothetical protein [Cohnella luojiensis]TFE30836.1 hypothetical protein E2980_03405 [Cohnella luojiensis]
MSDNNDVVIVNLDRPRELRFGHKALKRLSAVTGKGMDDMVEDEIDFKQLEEIFFYGLERDAREHNETLTMDQMEDILDCAESYAYLMAKMTEALQKATGNLTGNGQPAGKTVNQPNPSRGTGRNR